jgi:hypothetical protein
MREARAVMVAVTAFRGCAGGLPRLERGWT